ncbi:VIT1/CCC1 transporter family protein [Flavivirga rizhaonensis]|uniref:VIT1/CCC1 transporter family protein n=1 Tax=Flavivirga rizhaonensis TaxID=2559571 RepID=UPI0021D3E6C8|nr:VIT1/CCC1 transporter family protein [Flavivirga rizhaonensis]
MQKHKNNLVLYLLLFIFIANPLQIYVWDYIGNFPANLFVWTSILASVGFIFIGLLKTYVTQTSKIKGIFETLSLGILAALVSYFVGDILESIITG